MKNVEMTVKKGTPLTNQGGVLLKSFGPSSYLKTIIIASTEGNVAIPPIGRKKSGLTSIERSRDGVGVGALDT